MSALDFDPHISVEKPYIAHVRSPDYCVRTINLENISRTIETPFKVFPGNDVNKLNFSDYSSDTKNAIFESARTIQQTSTWMTLDKCLTEMGATQRNKKLRDIFKISKKFWENSLTTLSLTFPRNPFEKQEFAKNTFEGLDENSYIFLLNFIYSNSSAFVLVPDIKIKPESSITRYLEIIDFSVRQLSEWNNKPIFVPLQIDLSKRNLTQILTHYKNNNYSNICINFNNHPCDSDFSANLRSIKQIIDNYMNGLDVVLYYSHLKKEITPHIHDTKVAASDILTQFLGADFIGTERFGGSRNSNSDDPEYIESQALKNNYSSIEEYEQALMYHSTRLFSPKTYYLNSAYL
ncbi:hypothetical protein MSSIT_1170 [Methanosarcina siciliae T4/M]|uniref:Uncharacterized protein n=1 Tax=Methanosarcina siciliae T4/M TaxID=1434120 RepID=A0A0E3P2X8_9EURY|nr:hypothetical protein [Methanosarcina siciliae]AKB27889.1 hypothetical protein MSSIT_1170 [Methanosarcina siciliae T4/M]